MHIDEAVYRAVISDDWELIDYFLHRAPVRGLFGEKKYPLLVHIAAILSGKPDLVGCAIQKFGSPGEDTAGLLRLISIVRGEAPPVASTTPEAWMNFNSVSLLKKLEQLGLLDKSNALVYAQQAVLHENPDALKYIASKYPVDLNVLEKLARDDMANYIATMTRVKSISTGVNQLQCHNSLTLCRVCYMLSRTHRGRSTTCFRVI